MDDQVVSTKQCSNTPEPASKGAPILLRRPMEPSSIRQNSSSSSSSSSANSKKSIQSYFSPSLPRAFDGPQGPIDLTVDDEDDGAVAYVTEEEEQECKKPAISPRKAEKYSKAQHMNALHRLKLTRALVRLPHAFLRNGEEKHVCDCILQSLSNDEQIVLSRVLFLQGPWFRSSQAFRYLDRQGSSTEECSKAVNELVSHGILCGPNSEEEWLAAMSSPACSKNELFSVLRSFDKRAKADSNKDCIIDQLTLIAQRKSTIFGASQVRLKPRLEGLMAADPLVKVSLTAFRLCKRAICLSELYADLSITTDDEDAIVKDGDVVRFLSAIEHRGGARLPSAYSPGFAVAMGQEQDEVDDDEDDTSSANALFTSLFTSSDDLAKLEAAIDLSELVRVLVNVKVKDESLVIEKAPRKLFDVPGMLQKASDSHSSFIQIARVTDVVSAMEVAFEFERCVAVRDDHPAFLLALFHPCRPLCTAIGEAVTWLEDRKRYEEAVYNLRQLLLQCQSSGARYHPRRAHWWNRLVIDLGHIPGRKPEALEMCELALKDPSLDALNDPDLFGLRAKLLKHSTEAEDEEGLAETFLLQAPVVHRKAKPFGPAGKGSKAKGKQRFIEPEDSADVTCSVEMFALHHYAQEDGWRGIHTENFAMREVFRLVMGATVLGADLETRKAYRQRLIVYRNRALDLYAPFELFYRNRKQAIDSRLREIESWTCEELITNMSNSFHDQPEHIKRVREGRLSLACLQLIACCLGGKGVATIGEMFCREYRHLGMGGAPDLLLVRISDRRLLDMVFDDVDCHELQQSQVQGKDLQGMIKLVEVKSENDRLADRQVAWMNALHKRGFACEVLKIGTTNSLTVGRSVKKAKTTVMKAVRKLQRPTVAEDEDDIFESD